MDTQTDAKAATVPAPPAVFKENIPSMRDAIAYTSLVSYVGVLTDASKTYAAFTLGKIKDLNKTASSKSPHIAAAVAAEKKKIAELKNVKHHVKHMPYTSTLPSSTPCTIDIPAPLLAAFPNEKEKAKYSADFAVAEELNTAMRRLDLAETEQKRNDSTIKLANVNEKGTADFYYFDPKKPSFKLVQNPSDDLTRIAQLARNESYDVKYDWTGQTMPGEFKFTARAHAHAAAQILIPTRFYGGGDRAGEASATANLVSELGFAAVLSLTHLILAGYPISIPEFTPEFVTSAHMNLGLMIAERHGFSSPDKFLETLLSGALVAWSECSRIKPYRTRCPDCRPVAKATTACRNCGNVIVYQNRFEHHLGVEAIINRLDMLIGMTQQLLGRCPDAQSKYPQLWKFMLTFWSPQLIAFGSTEGFYLGKQHVWSYAKLTRFLVPTKVAFSGNHTAGVSLRKAMFLSQPIQIIHYEHMTAEPQLRQYAKGHMDALSRMFKDEYRSARLRYRCMLEPQSAVVAELHRRSNEHQKAGLLEHLPSRCRTDEESVIADVIFAYAGEVMPPSERFRSYQSILTEAKTQKLPVHMVQILNEHSFRDAALENKTRDTRVTDFIRSMNHQAIAVNDSFLHVHKLKLKQKDLSPEKDDQDIRGLPRAVREAMQKGWEIVSENGKDEIFTDPMFARYLGLSKEQVQSMEKMVQPSSVKAARMSDQ